MKIFFKKKERQKEKRKRRLVSDAGFFRQPPILNNKL